MAISGETSRSSHFERTRTTAMPMPSTSPKKKPRRASRAVNNAASITKAPKGLELVRCSGSPISATIAGIGGMVRSSDRGRKEPTIGHSVCASSIELPNAL